jgi:tetratricopeptide (TPR) repeat protein
MGTQIESNAQTDRVRLIAGGNEAGQIESTTNTIVQVRQDNRRTPVPVNEILTVHFAQEPIELTQARSAIRSGDYQGAVESLAKVNLADIRRDAIREDYQFQLALANARIALGSGDQNALQKAGSEMHEFQRKNPDSFHHFAAVEVMGEMLAAVGRYSDAQKEFARLAGAPWPDYKMRALVLEGRALAAQGMHEEAVRRFDEALAIDTTAPGADAQRLAARLGKAESQAEAGQAEGAIAAVEQVIAEAAPESIDLQARAHNVLGRCHLKSGSPKEALYAFLYVDVLCSSAGDAHAEALYQLIPLFRAVGRDEDARQAQERLLERYPQSTWAKQLVQ